MFRQIQKVVAGALCALTLTVAGVAPAFAHTLVHGRASQVQQITIEGDANTARTIAAEFVGVIHSVTMDHSTDTLYWSLLSRDGKQQIAIGEATLDEQDAIVSQISIIEGALRGATIRTRGYWHDDRFLLDLRVSFGDTKVAVTQALEPLEETER